MNKSNTLSLRYVELTPEIAGAVHNLSCCGCSKQTGWVAWRDACAAGWKKFRTNISTYTICPDCICR